MIYGARLRGGLGVLVLFVAGCPGGDDSGTDTGAMTSISASGTGDGSGDDGSGDDGSGDDGSGDDGSGDDGSGDDGMVDCTTPPSYASDIQPIWDAKCVAACHEDGGEWFPFILTDPSYDNVVETPASQNSLLNQVEPGDLDASYLWAKINNNQVMVGGSGVGMPKPPVGSTEVPEELQLTAEDMDTIEAWIACGAEP